MVKKLVGVQGIGTTYAVKVPGPASRRERDHSPQAARRAARDFVDHLCTETAATSPVPASGQQ